MNIDTRDPNYTRKFALIVMGTPTHTLSLQDTSIEAIRATAIINKQLKARKFWNWSKGTATYTCFDYDKSKDCYFYTSD